MHNLLSDPCRIGHMGLIGGGIVIDSTLHASLTLRCTVTRACRRQSALWEGRISVELSSLRSADPAMHFVSIDARWTHRSAMGSFDRSRPHSAERMGISTGNNRVGPIAESPLTAREGQIAARRLRCSASPTREIFCRSADGSCPTGWCRNRRSTAGSGSGQAASAGKLTMGLWLTEPRVSSVM